MLNGKHIILGVTGGIAAYKSAWLVRDFIKAGAEVQVVMTPSATEFITPLTLSTLSRREVIIEMFPSSPNEATDKWTEHIDLALWADCMLIAPASANTLAKITHGRADNFLTTLVLAARCPIVLSPAMDVDMYVNEVTQENLDRLREAGCFIIEPDSGELASGLKGPGRLPEIDRLITYVEDLLKGTNRDLEGKKILVTAGPTHEPIDPVRFIGNRSSGKMGFAIANAASLRGAEVTLISGPVKLGTPRHVRRINVQTAQEMLQAAEREFESTDALIMSAAVADYTPSTVATQKIKRKPNAGLSLELRENPDILKRLAERRKEQILIGFALETQNGIENAKAKLQAKKVDAIILNDPTEQGAGFDSDTNVVTFVTPGGEPRKAPKMSKFDVANLILTEVALLMKKRSASKPHASNEKATQG